MKLDLPAETQSRLTHSPFRSSSRSSGRSTQRLPPPTLLKQVRKPNITWEQQVPQYSISSPTPTDFIPPHPISPRLVRPRTKINIHPKRHRREIRNSHPPISIISALHMKQIPAAPTYSSSTKHPRRSSLRDLVRHRCGIAQPPWR